MSAINLVDSRTSAHPNRQVEDDNTRINSLKSKWRISFGELAQKVKLQEKVVFPIQSEQIHNDRINIEDYQFVPWGGGNVLEISQGLLCSEHFGSCIAVLLRGFQEEKPIPSHIGLVHITDEGDIEVFQRTLNKIMQLAAGRIQAFIGAGDESNVKVYQKIKWRMGKFSRIIIEDDLFGMAALDVNYLANNTLYRGTGGVPVVGFDKNFNPFMVLNIILHGCPNEAVSEKGLFRVFNRCKDL